MAAVGTSVDTGGMASAQQAMQQALDDIATAQSEVDNLQNTLMSMWKGEAATAFGGAVVQYISDLNFLNNSLTTIQQGMGSNAKVYVATNDSTVRATQSFSNGLPGL
jgi:WXG100 family type VII secretion target